MKNEFQEIISTKMHKLLEQQTEATKVTADAAKQLAKLQQTHELADSKRQQPMVDVSELAKAIRNAQESSHQPLPAVSMTKLVPKVSNVAKSLPKAVQSTKDQPIQPDFLMSKELKSLISKTDSNVPEIMSAIEGTQSISKTISEALDNLNSDKSNNISEDVAEDLNTDYSSKFDDVDESTIKEIASNSELKVSSEIKTDSVTSSRSNCESSPKSSVIKNASEGAAKKSTPVRGPSASPSTQYNYSEDDTFSEGTGLTESKLLAPDASNLSVFSEGESFNRFTIQMHKQHLEEESLRSKHQYGLLKKKESDLIGKVKEELTALQEQRKRLKESGAEGGEDKISAIKKKERAILLELKTRRSEINRLKQSIKVAEKERKLIMQQQKKLLKQQRPTRSGSSSKEDQDTVSSHTLTDKTQNSEEKTPKERVSASDSVHTEDSESQRSNSISKDLKAAERQIMQGIRKLERNKKYLNEKESSVLDKTKHLGKLIQSKQLRPSDDTSSDSSSIHEDAKTESDSFDKGSAVSVTSPSKMESLKKSIGTTLKTPLSPKLRRRHSSADSDDSLSVSQPETMSDHSDVEIRITTLQDELKRRMMTAAKLKKQQRSKSKEKLRIKEVALKKQIEKYDKLILETKADLEEPGAGEVVQPQIKTPYKQPSSPHDIARKASTESVTVSESISSAPPSPAPAASPLPNREPQPLHEEDRTVSCESSVDTILSNKEISEDIPASNTGGGQSYDRSYTADFTETPEVEEEEVKYLPERSRTPTPQATTKSVQEDEHSDLNYSDDFTSSSAASDAGGSDINPLQQQVLSVTVTEKKTTETKSGARNLAANLTAASKNLCREERVEKVAGDILDALVTDTCDKYKEVSKTFKTTTNVTDIKDGGVDLGDESSLSKTSPKTPSISPSAVRKPSPPPSSVISPRSRPQDLMLSTFDISSDSSDEGKICYCSLWLSVSFFTRGSHW